MRNSSSLDWLRFMHTPNDYRVSPMKVQNNLGGVVYRWKKYTMLARLCYFCY